MHPDRLLAIGQSDRGRLLFVVATLGSALGRIISARRVTMHERRTYEKESSRVSHAEPSKASLRKIPEADFTKGGWRRNPERAARIRKEGITIKVDGRKPYVLRKGAGRPKHGEEVGPSSVRSVRVPDALWHELKVRAKRQGTTVHARAARRYRQTPARELMMSGPAVADAWLRRRLPNQPRFFLVPAECSWRGVNERRATRAPR